MKITLIAVLLSTIIGCQSTPVQKQGSSANEIKAFMMTMGAQVKKPDQAELDKHPLGSDKNPIRVSGVQGEHRYIENLVCMNGEQVSSWNRLSSAGVSPHGFIMDLYNVICDTNEGVVETTLYMDMYHDDIEIRPAEGFTISPLSK